MTNFLLVRRQTRLVSRSGFSACWRCSCRCCDVTFPHYNKRFHDRRFRRHNNRRRRRRFSFDVLNVHKDGSFADLHPFPGASCEQFFRVDGHAVPVDVPGAEVGHGRHEQWTVFPVDDRPFHRHWCRHFVRGVKFVDNVLCKWKVVRAVRLIWLRSRKFQCVRAVSKR